MTDVRSISRRVDALAAALRAAGVDPAVSERLLGSAAAAAMEALTLDLLLAEPPFAPVAAEAPVAAPRPVRLAA